MKRLLLVPCLILIVSVEILAGDGTMMPGYVPPPTPTPFSAPAEEPELTTVALDMLRGWLFIL